MRLQLLPLTLEDTASYMSVGTSAFENDSIQALMFPPERFDPDDPYGEARWRLGNFLKRAKNPQARHLKVVDLDAEEDLSNLGVFVEEIREKVRQFDGEFGGADAGFGDGEMIAHEGEKKVQKARLIGQIKWVVPNPVEDGEAPAERGEQVGGTGKPEDDPSRFPSSLNTEVFKEVEDKLEGERRSHGRQNELLCECKMYPRRHV